MTQDDELPLPPPTNTHKPQRSLCSLITYPLCRHVRLLLSHSYVTDEVLMADYEGEGTEQAPYAVEFITNDPRNPVLFSTTRKWVITILMAFATFAITFGSSVYAGAADQIMEDFHVDVEVFTLGLSLYVLGFALGPLFWAPLSEIFGRQLSFTFTYGAFVIFNGATVASQNIQTLVILRFFSGAFGSSPLTNCGGIIADMFAPRERALAVALFTAGPFLGPSVGPIVGGFAGENIGWRWALTIFALFSGLIFVLCLIFVPETYAPVLLNARAKRLTKLLGKTHRSKIELKMGRKSFVEVFRVGMIRPWLLLLAEPIVLLLSIYSAIIYGTLYMEFDAYPIVFQQYRGWSEGIGGLAFTPLLIGGIVGIGYVILDNQWRYKRLQSKYAEMKQRVPPEGRLPPCMIASISIVVGLFLFAWTNYPNWFWLICMVGTTLFGFGFFLVFISIMNYLIDAYTIYAASVLAANTVLRSLFGVAFPLFTTYMYRNLGIHWASSVPAFMALACVPLPYVFYVFGPWIRSKCSYAHESERLLALMHH